MYRKQGLRYALANREARQPTYLYASKRFVFHRTIGYKTAQRHLAALKELSLIRDNGEDANSPNYKYTVNE